MTLQQPTLAFDASGRVAIDLACSRCRYNLRTLATDGRCSECGTPVLESLAARLAQLNAGTWLLVRGARLMALVTALSVVALVIAVLESARRPWYHVNPADALAVHLAAVSVLPAIVALLLTSRPDWAARSAPLFRLLVRVVLLAIVLLAFLAGAIEWVLSCYRFPRSIAASRVVVSLGTDFAYPLWSLHGAMMGAVRFVWQPLIALILGYTAWLAGVYGLLGLRRFGLILVAAVLLCMLSRLVPFVSGSNSALPRDADLVVLLLLWGGWTVFSLLVAVGLSARIRAATGRQVRAAVNPATGGGEG
ncbi:MAG: hypothetical protein HRU75_10315 [Planctomycetia bacterium]|nr:MAG: hypothetical protein HRU75_10315 [Planctomycetia bacterium]